jgi:hypothetical protein
MLKVRIVIEEVDIPVPFKVVGMAKLQMFVTVIDLQVLDMAGVQ